MAGLGEGHEDVLMVAGDVSSSLERLLETLTDLKKRYDQVRRGDILKPTNRHPPPLCVLDTHMP